MWKNLASGALGVLVIFVPYLGFDTSVQNVALVMIGIIIAILSFWSVSEKKTSNANLNQ